MFIGPPMAEPHGAELLVRTSDLMIWLTPPELKFESVGSIEEMEHIVEEWAELLHALTLMTTGRATLTIARHDRIPAVTFPVDQPVTGLYIEELPVISEPVDGWLPLLANAGIRFTARFKFDAFWHPMKHAWAADILLKPKSRARFEFQNLEIENSSSLPEELSFNTTSFADKNIIFNARFSSRKLTIRHGDIGRPASKLSTFDRRWTTSKDTEWTRRLLAI